MSAISTITAVALLICLAVPADTLGIPLGDGVILRCQCIDKEKRPIGRHISTVEVIPASSHCINTEIIATLKNSGKNICLDPDAPWVKKVLRMKIAEPTR